MKAELEIILPDKCEHFEEFAKEMEEAADIEDIEDSHRCMDRLMTELLRSIGYKMRWVRYIR